MPRSPAKKKKTTLRKRKPLVRKKKTTRGKKKGKKAPWYKGRFARFVGKAIALCVIWGTIIVGTLIAWYAYDMPDIKQIAQPERRPAITLLANDGRVFARYGDLQGRRVSAKEVPPHLVHAILAIEDRRFYSHFGIDLIGLARALYNNLRAGRVVQGGSTITQQLAKNLFLTPERTTRRKVQEMLLSFWLEHTYTKNQILTAYLNRVYLGSGAYGAAAAADIYYGKPVSALNLRECATLAGLLRAPSRYSPNNNPKLAYDRAKIVLKAMQDAGYIDETDRALALADVPLPKQKPGAGGDGRYFADWVVGQIRSLLENAPQDVVILTTLDLDMQRVAERKLDGILAENGEARSVSEGALVSITKDGAVRAMVGGRDYGSSQFNRVVQAKRQPGSAFKPIVYLAALSKGMSPDDKFYDEALQVGNWSPQNYSGEYKGEMTARQALAESINTVAVKVAQKVGVSKIIDTARALGITSPMNRDLSMALGTNAVSPLELTGAYAAIASGGRVVMPYGIKEVRGQDGKILFQRDKVNYPITVDPEAVATLVDMLQSTVSWGTGKRARLDRPVAGKTGTSSDYRDAWFLGFTADYVTGVWLGNDDNKPTSGVTGGSLPAQLWHDYMFEAEKNLPVQDLLHGLPSPRSGASDEWGTNHKEEVGDSLGDLIRSLLGQDNPN